MPNGEMWKVGSPVGHPEIGGARNERTAGRQKYVYRQGKGDILL